MNREQEFFVLYFRIVIGGCFPFAPPGVIWIGLPVGLIFGWHYGFIITFVLPALITVMLMLFLNVTAGMVAKFYTGPKAKRSPRELLELELPKVRHLRNQQKPDEALKLLNTLLSQDEKCAEALFLKARILHEDYEDLIQARKILKKLLAGTDADPKCRKWAEDLIEEINSAFLS